MRSLRLLRIGLKVRLRNGLRCLVLWLFVLVRLFQGVLSSSWLMTESRDDFPRVVAAQVIANGGANDFPRLNALLHCFAVKVADSFVAPVSTTGIVRTVKEVM